MGLERVVRFPSGTVPDWERVADCLKSVGEAPTLRMIDGQLAFPDEPPGRDWSELRIGLPSGMVTFRRQANLVRCLIWGNADADLIRGRERCAWAFAESGAGLVVNDDGTDSDAEHFKTKFDSG